MDRSGVRRLNRVQPTEGVAPNTGAGASLLAQMVYRMSTGTVWTGNIDTICDKTVPIGTRKLDTVLILMKF